MKSILLFFLTIVLFASCTKEGCTNPDANNYNKRAKEDNGTCVYPELRDDLVGQYSVEKTIEIYIGTNQGVSTYMDTIEIEKGGYYNSLYIEYSTYHINFQNGQLTLVSNATKSPPIGSGTLTNNQINISKTTYVSSGIKGSHTFISGYKIN